MGRANPLTTHINAGIPAGRYVKADAEIHSYQDAVDFLAGAAEKQVARNVVVHRVNRDTIGIKVYNTTVIKYHNDDTFEVDNGGYNTLTTSTRVNQFGPKGWLFWHHQKVLHGRHNHTMNPDLKMYRHGVALNFGKKWSIHGVPYYAVCDVYNVKEDRGDDYPEIRDDAYEYTCQLFTHTGDEVDSWDSIEGYTGSGQCLTEEQAASAAQNVMDDVREGKASQWFNVD